MVAGLIRLTGDWDLAEDAVQDAVERALVRWPLDGMPRSPGAWLTTVARHRAIDVLRRRRTERAKLQEVALLGEQEVTQPERWEEDRLRLIYTCCHPALPLEGRVALTLKTVAGLTTAEIARAFLVSEPTLSQRLLRTKRKIVHANIPFRVPPPELLEERTAGVLAVLYLIVNEGYGRRDDHLVAEGHRLVSLVVDLMPDHDEARSLLALVTLLLARRPTRFDDAGDLVPMEDQDRTRWNAGLLEQGVAQLRRASASGRPPGPYRLQAEISARHGTALDARATPWSDIVSLYDALLIAQPSPVVALNRAVAVGFRDGWEAGLGALDDLAASALSGYYLLPAARADFLRRLDRREEARTEYRSAAELAPDGPERRYLGWRISELGQ